MNGTGGGDGADSEDGEWGVAGREGKGRRVAGDGESRRAGGVLPKDFKDLRDFKVVKVVKVVSLTAHCVVRLTNYNCYSSSELPCTVIRFTPSVELERTCITRWNTPSSILRASQMIFITPRSPAATGLRE